MSIFLYGVTLDCSCFLSDTALRFSSYVKLCFLEFRALKLTIKLAALPLLSYKKIWIPKCDDEDMSIFLYRIVLDCSCLLSDTAVRFSSLLKLCISVFGSVKLTIKLASLPLILYKKRIIPKPDDQDMSIFLYSVTLDCSCLLSNTDLRFSSYLKLSSQNSDL